MTAATRRKIGQAVRAAHARKSLVQAQPRKVNEQSPRWLAGAIQGLQTERDKIAMALNALLSLQDE